MKPSSELQNQGIRFRGIWAQIPREFGHLPAQSTGDCSGFWSLTNEAKWPLVIWMMVAVTFCARRWRHTLCSRACHKQTFGTKMRFSRTGRRWGKEQDKELLGMGAQSRGAFLLRSVCPEFPAEPGTNSQGRTRGCGSFLLSLGGLTVLGNILHAEYKSSQPTNPSISIHTWQPRRKPPHAIMAGNLIFKLEIICPGMEDGHHNHLPSKPQTARDGCREGRQAIIILFLFSKPNHSLIFPHVSGCQ